MSTSKLKKYISKQSLSDAWDSLYKKAKKQTSSGVDDMTVARFAGNKDKYINEIYQQIHSKTGYKFSQLYGNPIEKPNSTKKRIICIPTVADRLVQRCVGVHLTDFANKRGVINEASFGFVTGNDGIKRGVAAARDRAIVLRNKSPWAYKSDISAFFDTIPRPQVVEQTINILRAPSFRMLIEGAVSCEIDERDPAIARVARENGIIRGKGIRQGMPLSPLFSNIILRDFDRGLLEKGKKLVRYADDFIIMADNAAECCEIDALARKLLLPLGLKLPTLEENTKTQIKAPHEEIDFLGLSLTPISHGKYQLVIPGDQLDKINRGINMLKDIRELVKSGITITKFSQKLERQIAGYKAAYSEAQNLPKLNAILEQAKSQMLRQIFISVFSNEKVQSLNDDYKKFFCLNG